MADHSADDIRQMATGWGICRECMGVIESRERHIDGNDRCERGHVRKSSKAWKLNDDQADLYIAMREKYRP